LSNVKYFVETGVLPMPKMKSADGDITSSRLCSIFREERTIYDQGRVPGRNCRYDELPYTLTNAVQYARGLCRHSSAV